MTAPASPFWPRLRGWAPWIALFTIALALRAWRLDFPNEVAFDESLVGRFSSHYFSGEYYFDIHPPHLKLLYAFLAWLGGMPAGYGFPAPETAYPSSFYVWMRLFPALCGAGLPLAIAGLARQLGAPRLWALAAGWAAALDSALITESRLILNDIPLLFFGCLGWLLFARWRQSRAHASLALAALFLAIAASIKWTGLAFSAPPLALLAWEFAKSPSRRAVFAAAALLGASLAWQAAGYALHFQLLTQPARDNVQTYLGADVAEGLYGDKRPDSLLVRSALIASASLELNVQMARSASLVGPHPYSSRWISWPAGWRGIYFWNDRAPSNASRIYMLPNLAVWWIGAFGAAYLIITLAPRLIGAATGRSRSPIDPVEAALAFAFLIHWLPFALIERPMFLYHYFPSLIVSLIICARLGGNIPRSRPFAFAWLALCAALFLWMAPLTYGLPLDEAGLAARMILSSWP